MEKLIKEINRYAKLAKERELTEAEKLERGKLRNEYIQIFKGNMRKELEAIIITDEIFVNKSLDYVKEKIQNVDGIIKIELLGLKTKITYDTNKLDVDKISGLVK